MQVEECLLMQSDSCDVCTHCKSRGLNLTLRHTEFSVGFDYGTGFHFGWQIGFIGVQRGRNKAKSVQTSDPEDRRCTGSVITLVMMQCEGAVSNFENEPNSLDQNGVGY